MAAAVTAVVSVSATKTSRVLTTAASKVLLAIQCSCPGRMVPQTRICVSDKVHLRDVLTSWASGVMKTDGGALPPAARIMGSGMKALDPDQPLKDIRKHLPVRSGRLTVFIDWPEMPAAAPAPPAPKEKAAKTSAEKAKQAAAEREKRRKDEAAKIARQKSKEKENEAQRKEKARAEKAAAREAALKAKQAEKVKRAMNSEEAKAEKERAKAEKEGAKKLKPSKENVKNAVPAAADSSSDSDSDSDSAPEGAGLLGGLSGMNMLSPLVGGASDSDGE